VKIDLETEKGFQATADVMERRGMKVVGVAMRYIESLTEVLAEYKPFCFVGMVGLEEAVRPNAIPYLRRLQRMNVLIVMFTNESLGAADQFCKAVGLLAAPLEELSAEQVTEFMQSLRPSELRSRVNGFVISGREVESKTAAEWDEMLTTAHTLIFARCSAKQRAKAVQALQHAGHLVCMCATDDNNILALEAADTSLAHGLTCSDHVMDICSGLVEDGDICSAIYALEFARRTKTMQYPRPSSASNRSNTPWKELLADQHATLSKANEDYKKYQRSVTPTATPARSHTPHSPKTPSPYGRNAASHSRAPL
jgi:magnesium-transporting ATPase (P-type)